MKRATTRAKNNAAEKEVDWDVEVMVLGLSAARDAERCQLGRNAGDQFLWHCITLRRATFPPLFPSFQRPLAAKE